MSLRDGLQHKDRAEVLAYNNCFGDKYELAEQFKDVARLSKRCEKPVFHLMVRLAPGDQLTRKQLIELGEDLAKEFDVADHQYLLSCHKDTPQPHIHLIANRVGLDGKAASDSNSYRKMAAFCRRQEKKLGLTEVLSPRAFLTGKQRRIPRQDARKEKLRKDIWQTLQKVNSYAQFERKMQKLGYTVVKGRGIAFIDEKKVRTKGSQVGFSLSKIEKVLALRQKIQWEQVKQEVHEAKVRRVVASQKAFKASQQMRLEIWQEHQIEQSPMAQAMQELNAMIDILLSPELTDDYVPYELTQEGYQKRRKKEERQRRGIRR